MKKLLFVMLFVLGGNLHASDWLLVSDMSQLKYQIRNNKVYLRNLNAFDASWLGCCYSYYIDLTTDEGKVTWSTMLAKMALRESYYIGVDLKTTNPSIVTFSGEW